jgi:hypothetical protein
MPEKDALLEMNWVSLLEKQWNSVKQCAMLTPLVFRLNIKPWTVALAICPTLVLNCIGQKLWVRPFTSKVESKVETTTITATLPHVRATLLPVEPETEHTPLIVPPRPWPVVLIVH